MDLIGAKISNLDFTGTICPSEISPSEYIGYLDSWRRTWALPGDNRMGWRKDRTVPENAFESAEEYYASVRAGLRDKANHNKFEAQGSFVAIITCTLLAPLFVTLGDSFFLAKVVPSVLSVSAAALTSWLQLRKPQRLWALYRRGQRELEQAKANYDFDDGDFEGVESKDKLLARKVTSVARSVHDEWEGLIPDPASLGSSATKELVEK